MSGYGCFARFYDLLTDNVDYKARAERAAVLIRRELPEASLVLDLACGTGSMTVELAALGFDMIGVDASEEMLSAAIGKTAGDLGVLYLRQEAEELDLYGTVDACVCGLDSLNHLPGKTALERAVTRVSLFLNPGGVFVFDMNTPYKHRKVLADNVYVYERELVFCVWRNAWDPADDRVDITLDFFVPQRTGTYAREQEAFSEYAYSIASILEIGKQAGLELAALYDDISDAAPNEETQRIAYVMRKAK